MAHFKVGDIVKFKNPDTQDDEVLGFEVLGEEDSDPDEFFYWDFPVYQVLVVRYPVDGGKIGVGLCTENEICLLLLGCSAVSFGDIVHIVRGGVEVAPHLI